MSNSTDLKSNKPSKSRNNHLKIDLEEVYGEDDEFQEEDDVEEISRRTDKVMDLTDYMLEPRGAKIPRKSKPQENNEPDSKPTEIFSSLLNIQDYLISEGFTFEEAHANLANMKEDFASQMEIISQEKELVVKDLRPGQYLVDVSKLCQLDTRDGEVTTVLVFTQLKRDFYHVILNSTIPNNPLKCGSEYLGQLISEAVSVRDAIDSVVIEIRKKREILQTMKLSSSFYADKSFSQMVQESSEWESQLINMNWSNRHYHSTWANSKELSTVGSVLEWPDLCEMIKQARPARTCTPFQGDACGVCSRQKRLHELFVTTDETKVKCTECLRDEFYKELRARRVPIDLKTDCADELEYLPTFIPLTVINLYVRMVAEQIYTSAGAIGSFEKCPSCKLALTFEATKNQNVSCPCGYSWCHECKQVPHWPMKCKEFAEWDKKFSMRYAMSHAQGNGSDTLMQVTCSCGKAIFNVLLPEDLFQCPKCEVHVDSKSMKSGWEALYSPHPAPARKKLKQMFGSQKRIDLPNVYKPIRQISTKISKIPGIRTAVLETCGAARDVRFDESTHNQAVKREHVLLRKNLLDGGESVENAMGTVVYLTEMVTAWMHVTNQYDRNIKISLETMMENRKVLVEMLEKEDSEGVTETLRKIRKGIDSVVKAVEKKM